MDGLNLSLINTRLRVVDDDSTPIGPYYLIAALAERGRQVEYRDLATASDYNPFAVDAVLAAFEQAQAPVLGVSLFSVNLPVVLIAAQQYRHRGGCKPIILGGPGPNGVERRILEKFPAIDIAVRGEGERVLPDILDALDAGRVPQGPGIFARHADGTITGADPVRIADLDALPCPDRTRMIAAHPHAVAPVVTARGCPFSCSFCDIITMWGRKVGYRSVPNVIDEIKAIAETGMTEIRILDDTLTANRVRLREFCSALRATGLNIRWKCFARADQVDEDLLADMADSGCCSIYFGVDAGNENGWKAINKRLSRDMVVRNILAAVKYSNATASFIWGYPFETFSDFADMVDLSLELAEGAHAHPYRLGQQHHLLVPEPATPLYSQYGHTVRFAAGMPGSVFCGRPLASFAGQAGYDECIELIRTDSMLFSPFYYYPSENFMEKLLVFNDAPFAETTLGGRGRPVVEKLRRIRQLLAAK